MTESAMNAMISSALTLMPIHMKAFLTREPLR